MSKIYRILIADDDADHVTIVKAILEQHGYEALEAGDGNDTLEQVRLHQPDLVLLDIMMPGIDGIEVVRRLKDAAETRDVPIIMFSARSGTREIMESFNYGATNYIIKPIDAERLLEKIQAALRKEEFRESLESRSKLETPAESGGSPAEAEQADSPAGSLGGAVARFLAALDGPLSNLRGELAGFRGTGQAGRELRLATLKLDAIAALCTDLKDFAGESAEASVRRSDQDESS
ncbi:MAG: response regulator [Candidatus Riflebacteria bacterium]|nr:response regulator [Candidatus Riflebacteria bacterium]